MDFIELLKVIFLGIVEGITKLSIKNIRIVHEKKVKKGLI